MALFTKTKTQDETVKPAIGSARPLLSAVLKHPRISEKATGMAKLGKYVFNVERNANKVQVKKAVEHSYKVKVVSVNMVNNQGKAKNSGRSAGFSKSFKKAVVTLKAGDKIEL